MPIFLDDEQLIELLSAVFFREAGFVAGVPRRNLEGRSGIHQAPFLVIERSLTAFGGSTVLLPKIIKGNIRQQWEQVMWLQGVVQDLKEAAPKNHSPLPEVTGQSIGEYFHTLYGGSRYEGEFLSVEYKGLLLIYTEIFKKIRQFARAQGMSMLYLPDSFGNKLLGDWLYILKDELYKSLHNNVLTVKSLLRHTRKVSDYRSILKKIRRPDQDLGPGEVHDLLTIISALLRGDKLRPLLEYIRKLTVGSLNAQPVLLQVENVVPSQLIIGAADFYLDYAKKHKGRSLFLARKLGFQAQTLRSWANGLHQVGLYPDNNHFPFPEALKNLDIKLFLSTDQVDFLLQKKGSLCFGIKDGLTLTADLYLVK
ncbi:MAG: hypothetical protein AB1420_02535 [Bacillota bacterium]